ncbi:hypothetical protein V1Y59_20545 [Gordonia sp. PKS22-38]|uniref:ABC transporter permease n=1 Tax=Gordonia prachuapensis TaxID=3115651 RepID=A0ABU7MYR5_9ACTN|nr:hypothetical protein [Gordonia sp. PKS22-38]
MSEKHPDPLPTPEPETPPETPVARTLSIAAALTAVIAIIVLAFSWPALTADPQGISIAVTGPQQAVTQVEEQLSTSGEVYDVTVVEDRDAAVAGIEARDYMGGIVLGAEPEVLTASANGAVNEVVAQLAVPLEANLIQQSGVPPGDQTTVTVTDIAPFSEDDPNGSLLSSAFFPMLFGGIIGGVLIATVIVGSRRRILAVTVYSIVGGIVLAGILQLWFGSIQGSFLLNVSAFAMAIAAIAAPMIGCVALIGRAGTAIGPVVMMLFANPISGSALPSQFLPGAWGEIGQYFPPGASATLVRELSYFPNADTASSWLVLAGWIVGGVILTAIAYRRSMRTPNTPEPLPADESRVLSTAATS